MQLTYVVFVFFVFYLSTTHTESYQNRS